MTKIVKSAHFQSKGPNSQKRYGVALLELYGKYTVAIAYGYEGGKVTRDFKTGFLGFPIATKIYDKTIRDRLNKQYVPAEANNTVFDPDADGEMIHAVNVTECTDGTIISVRSFPDNENGNRNAEELFTKVAHENGLDGDASPYLDDGVFEHGAYSVFITHS